MKKITYLLALISIIITTYPQESGINLELYKQFLLENENLTYNQLTNNYSAGKFEGNIYNSWNDALYFDSLEQKLGLTEDEISLIKKNGFMVSQRLSDQSFGNQFSDIYLKDLPVFVSTDALMHAFHTSYDKILKETEINYLIPELGALLNGMISKLPELEAKYSDSNMQQMLRDVDLYISTALYLLNDGQEPYFEENVSNLSDIISYINSYSAISLKLFSDTNKIIDFSQFKPRGHYTDTSYPELAKYFKTMIWLGRIELYLIAPEGTETFTKQDCQRQTIDAVLLSELISLSAMVDQYNKIDDVIRAFTGDQDNVTLPDFRKVLSEINLLSAEQLLDTLKFNSFQQNLSSHSFADQKILSQILIKDPFNPDDLKPASAFLLFGQRFVIDSYVTGSVVYDKINHGAVKRMLPSTLDILFALGNDAAAQLLKSELEEFKYSTNLTGLRYLIDSYGEDYWGRSIYNSWLNSIRALNPPGERNTLPTFMQTAAWWQQKMNSQLASWTELRHDNLLYAKQSYTGGVSCFFPYGYVEPVPEFYRALKVLLENSNEKLSNLALTDVTPDPVGKYFEHFIKVADTLESIASKELVNVPLTYNEKMFLHNMLFKNPKGMCGAPPYVGWYPQLYYNDFDDKLYSADYIVADYHTAPTDETGYPVGWVKHAGTGSVDLAVITANLPGVGKVAFAGPVSSYHEYTTTNFLRLTDEEWSDEYLEMSFRPDWTNLYLADKNGSLQASGTNLVTDVKNDDDPVSIPKSYITAVNYPNPFNPETIIKFNVPSALANNNVRLKIYDIQGREIKELLNKELPSGIYLTKWDATNNSGGRVSSGIYLYEVKVGGQQFVGKMNLLK